MDRKYRGDVMHLSPVDLFDDNPRFLLKVPFEAFIEIENRSLQVLFSFLAEHSMCGNNKQCVKKQGAG